MPQENDHAHKTDSRRSGRSVLRCSSLKVYFTDKYLAVFEVGSIDDQYALAWCKMGNGSMILSTERVQFNDAIKFCEVNGGKLWSPSERLVTGSIWDHDEIAYKNRSISDAASTIFNLFSKDLEMQQKRDLELAWTDIQSRVPNLFTSQLRHSLATWMFSILFYAI